MRLIDAEQIGLTDMEIIMCDGNYKKALEMIINKIANAPTIDAVKHGRWTRLGDNSYKCSECGEVSCCFAHYCPDCGARMWERA